MTQEAYVMKLLYG